MQRSWIELKSTDSACIDTESMTKLERCYHLCRTLLRSSKFCSHMSGPTYYTSTLYVYMDDDVASMEVSDDLDIFSKQTCPWWHGGKKKIAKSKSHSYFDLLLPYDICWWWMQMSYRTEAYRISITSSRNSADRNVAVALTCTLLCYWRKSFTIDSSH